ncbi:hypothetical protein [Azospirillum sp. B4]|uniref:hypothetical protein n=1 Tax=Azospirillum sp. B4 TaxID=95605 RepID=UPI000349171D|nr:hypothetical protein [Azospirillum sp. B4]
MSKRLGRGGGLSALMLAAVLFPATVGAQQPSQAPTAAPVAAPAATGPAATQPNNDGGLVGEIIITPSFLPTPEEVKAYHDEEYARLKGIYAPPPPVVSRGDVLSRPKDLNTGTVAGPKSVNCANVGECRSAYGGN